ncbi:MAG: menaquinol oxidoreductase [Geobacteraceae bacterium GWC2_58_44]|nr:MAG: menaquinol oxidoreductase [Geobacteraceae bacterium GWC2_58_44]HBG06135.1 menaquinol oxidoreductase [Geobacter sp.]
MEQTGNNETEALDDAASDPRASLRRGLTDEIKRLRRFSNRGLWALSLFLMVSTIAWRDFWFLPPAQEIVASLGAPPTPMVISLVLILYTFSAIILSLSRMMAGLRHSSSFCHVGYLLVFYLFYYFAEALPDNYWAVFGAGFTILCLESYRIWTFCSENILKKVAQLAYVERTGRLPVEDDSGLSD